MIPELESTLLAIDIRGLKAHGVQNAYIANCMGCILTGLEIPCCSALIFP